MILAKALGKMLAETRGLKRLQLPGQLGNQFAEALVAAANQKTGSAEAAVAVLHPTEAPFFMSPERAAALRSRDDGAPARALVVNFANEFRELKTLEAFRLLNPSLLPGGLASADNAELTIRDISAAVVQELAASPGILLDFDLAPAAKFLTDVSAYLASAYATIGSGEVAWDQAWWQHLNSALETLVVVLRAWSDRDIEAEDFSVALYAAAGLPSPSNPAGGYKAQHDPAAYARILGECWDSDVEAETSSRDLARTWVEEGESRSVNEFPLVRLFEQNDFTDARARKGHLIPAVSLLGGVQLERAQAWALVGEDAFFSQARAQAKTELRLVDDTGEVKPLLVVGEKNAIHVLQVPSPSLSGSTLELGTYQLTVEGDHAHTLELVEVSCSPQALEAEVTDIAPAEGNATRVTVRLSMQISKATKKWREATYRLETLLRGNGSEVPTIVAEPLHLYLPFPGSTSLLVYESRKGEKDGRRLVPPQRSYTVAGGAIEKEDSPDARELQAPANITRVNLYAVGDAALDGRGTEWTELEIPAVTAAASPGIQLGSGLRLEFADDIVSITPDEQSATPISPILAAAQDTVASDDPAEPDTFKGMADSRWVVEQFQAENFIRPELALRFKSSLGQVHFAIDEERPDADQVVLHEAGVMTLGQIAPVAQLPADLDQVESVTRFWEAFQALQLHELVGERSAANAAWPSKLDLRKLDRGAVEAYLGAYLEMLEAAKLGPQYRGLAYPFSCIGFSKITGVVRGVLLSALHPVRLAWNWAAQMAAANAAEQLTSDDAVNLLRFMDGSELPLAGPALSLGEPYIATPLSPGEAGLFATWTFLSAPGAMSGEKVARFGANPFPAGSVSGLNADSVGAAIRDYLRVNPFVTSLDISLYTMEKRARSLDLDEAIVKQLDALLGGEVGNLPGGLQIHDSAKREGNPPRRQEVLARVLSAQQKRQVTSTGLMDPVAPFAWRLTTTDAEDVDIRFLEDSIVSVSVEPTSEVAPGNSVVPSLPVARRSLWEHPAGAPSASHTSLGAEQAGGLEGFTAAVDALEALAKDGAGLKRVATIPQALALKDRKARWLVAGNMNLDPRALSSALRDMQTGAVLWEWRPPFMERRAAEWDSIVPARPYAVIANPNPDFMKQVDACIAGIAGEGERTTATAVMSELGTRGVGLASLLSMGHQQSRGAIGFYLGFETLRHWQESAPADSIRMVLPLDALNPVLQLLAGENAADVTRKADLLLLEATATTSGFELLTRPVEIKMHASNGAPHGFPSPSSGPVKDALDQLTQTGRLLAELEKRMGLVSTVPLLQSALAAILETSLSLATGETGPIARDLMLAAANGDVEVRAGPGVLLWFDAGASDEGMPFVRGNVGPQQYLMVDPRVLLQLGNDHDVKTIAALLETMLVSEVAAAREPGANDEDEVSPEPSGHRETGAGEDESAPAPTTPETQNRDDDFAAPAADSSPARAAGMPVQIGWAKDGLAEEAVYFDPRDTRINQLNMGVVGDLGTGKTQFLKALVYQLTRPVATQEKPPKAFIFDYKKDYVDAQFVGLTGAKVLDPSKQPIPLNFFSVPEGAGKFETASRALLFADTVDKIYSIGPNQHQALRSAVLDAYGETSSPMLADVLERYQDATSGNDSVTSALSLMVDFGLFEPSPEKLVSFESMFDRTVVVALGNIAEAGTQVQNLLVTLFLNLLHVEYMKSREKMPFVTGSDGITRRVIDSFVLVDEAHNIMNYEFESLRKLLLEGREFGMGVILSSQYLSHFKTKKTNWAEPLLTWAIHKVPNVTPAELNKLGFKTDLEAACERISSLEVHRSLFKSPVGKAKQGVWVREKPFYEFVNAS